MANTIKIKRGIKANVPILARGELAYATDTNELFIGVLENPSSTEDNVLINDISAELLSDDVTEIVSSLAGSGLIFNEGDDELEVKFATSQEGLDGTLDNVVMSPLLTAEATAVLDGGDWVAPVVTFTEIGETNVKFTIENEEDFEVTVKYELNTPPTENSVVIDANDVSEELEITGLDDGTEYVLYVQAFVGSEAVSVIVEYSFTTEITFDDPFGAPGAQFFIASTTSENPDTQQEETAGFFGLVSQEEFFGDDTTYTSMSDVIGPDPGLDFTQGTTQFTTDPLLKFLHRGKIKYINQRTIRESISWDHIASKINVFGGTTLTIDGRDYKVRLMRGWGQVSANTSGGGTLDYENGPLYTISYTTPGEESDAFGDSGVNWPTNTSPWNAASPNEWNTLMFPIASATQTQTGSTPDWANFSNEQLQVFDGDGRGTLTQETNNTSTSSRVARGNYGMYSVSFPGYTDSFPFGLRLVFELDETNGGGN